MPRTERIIPEKDTDKRFDLFSPTDFRYYVPELAPFLSEEAFIHYKAKVEGALAKQLAKSGICDSAVAKEIDAACQSVHPQEVYDEEKRIKHDIRALVNVIRRKVSDRSKPFVHLTATSYDIVDTANALRFKDAIRLVVLRDLIRFENVLIKLTKIYASTIQVGRTHGQHAEPITFGYYLSYYVSRIGKRILSLEEKSDNLAGKFAGAVGVYGPLSLIVKNPERFEKELLDSLGLLASEVSTQIVQPEAIADLMHVIVSTFSVLANLARDMRHLQRTEIGEIAEAFGSKQVGSSTMPQKRNPINFENVEGLWKKFMPQMISVYMDEVSEHQRDLTNSSSQRYLPELIVVFDYCVRRLTSTIWNFSKNQPKIEVDLKNMERNLSQSLDQMRAEPFYILLALSGDTNAHERVREVVQRSISDGSSFREALESNDSIRRYYEQIPKSKRKYVNDPRFYTGIAKRKAIRIALRWEKVIAGIQLETR